VRSTPCPRQQRRRRHPHRRIRDIAPRRSVALALACAKQESGRRRSGLCPCSVNVGARAPRKSQNEGFAEQRERTWLRQPHAVGGRLRLAGVGAGHWWLTRRSACIWWARTVRSPLSLAVGVLGGLSAVLSGRLAGGRGADRGQPHTAW